MINNRKASKREIVTVAEAKRSEKKRSTVEHNIQYDRVTGSYILELNWGMENGKTKRTHETFRTLQEARDRKTEHKEQMRKRKNPGINAKMTLGECMNEYITGARIEETTRGGYRVIERRVKTTSLYGKRIAKIKRRDIDDYITFIRENTTLKNKTINKDYSLIHRALQYAVYREYITSNPAEGVEKLKEEKFEIDPLSLDEMKIFYQRLKESNDWALIVAVYLGVFHGLRRGEITGLKWDMVSFDENLIKIKETITQVDGKVTQKGTKTPKSTRNLEMNPIVGEALLGYRDFQKENHLYKEYVIVNPWGKYYCPTSINRKFNKFIERNNLRKVRFHDLRHTYGTRAIAAGANPVSVSGAMGHEKTSTTLNLYVHSKALDGSKEVNSVFGKIFGED